MPWKLALKTTMPTYGEFQGMDKLYFMEEIEVKFLDINPEKIQEKLKDIGAEKQGEYFYRRRIFDYPDLRLDKEGAWIRLRDEGNKITLAFKKRIGIKAHDGKYSDSGMKEIEIEVSDFDKTGLLLEQLGFIEKFYQENKRIRWVKGDIEFDIDFWPKLNPYLEIEAPSWDKIDKAILLLGLDKKDKKIFSTQQVYRLKGINEIDYQKMTFGGFVKKKDNS
ncbi:MAG: class IV adenylate cyclase [Patescibacteria group bacterium]